MYAEDPDDLLITFNPLKPRFKGKCKWHKKFYGRELEVERDCVSSKGYYVCEDCKRIIRMTREKKKGYTRSDGVRVRAK